MQKDDLNGHIFQNGNWCSLKSDQLLFFFSNFDCQRLFHRKDIKWEKKLGGSGLLSGKMEAMHSELNKTVEAPTSSYSVAIDFFTIDLFCACS